MSDNTTAGRLATDAPADKSLEKPLSQYSTLFQNFPLALEALPSQKSCARHLTEGRQRGKHLADPSASIGNPEQDFEATYYGTLAELLLYDWLERQGQRPEYTLLDKRAVTKADFRLDGLRYEVKSAPPGKPYLAISQRQHLDPRRQCDFYLCALYDSEDTLRICSPIPHAEVTQWTLMHNGHEPYFSKHRAELLIPSASIRLVPDSAQLKETSHFLQTLFAGYDDSALRLELRPAFPQWCKATLYPLGDAPGNWQFLTPSGVRKWFPVTAEGIEQAAQYALGLRGFYEVYFGVLPRVGRSGKAADVPFASCLWCDIDGGFEGVAGAQARLDAALQSGKLPAPDFILVSGGGLHVYWRLHAPILLPDDGTRLRFKQTLERLCRVIGGESPAAHADSSRADVASILRVPGTYNRKREQEPRPVSILPASTPEPHTLTWWNAHLPALPAPLPAQFPKPDLRTMAAQEGLLRWARKPYPQGQRHKDLAGAAAWLIRDLGIEKSLAKELLMLKAQASVGMRQITPDEVEEIVQWA